MKIDEPLVADESLVSYCGFYCGACPLFLKKKCSGCRGDSPTCAVGLKSCRVRPCCIENSYSTCADCTKYATVKECKDYNPIAIRFGQLITFTSRRKGIEMIKQMGKKGFMDFMVSKRWVTIKRLALLMVLLIGFSGAITSHNYPYRKQVITYKTVAGHDIKANVFIPELETPCPVLIYFHGGGFIFGNRDQGLNDAFRDRLLANGIAVVSASYRLAPETKIDGIVEDVSDALRWFRENGAQLGIDTSRIVAAGGSAGGYLALTTGFYPQNAPRAIVSISAPTGFAPPTAPMGDTSILSQPGPYDVVQDTIVSYGDTDKRLKLWQFLAANNLWQQAMFGFDPYYHPERLKPFKLEDNITPSYPTTLIVHAHNDNLVGVDQAQELFEFFQERGINSKLYLVDNGHSSELIRANPDAIEAIVEFIKLLK